jgi:hypothetical protein
MGAPGDHGAAADRTRAHENFASCAARAARASICRQDLSGRLE